MDSRDTPVKVFVGFRCELLYISRPKILSVEVAMTSSMQGETIIKQQPNPARVKRPKATIKVRDGARGTGHKIQRFNKWAGRTGVSPAYALDPIQIAPQKQRFS